MSSVAHPHWRLVGLLAALLVAGCSSTITAEAAGEPPFPECKADAYTFVGRTSLQALGLAHLWPEESGSPAEVWITDGPVTIDADGPAGGPVQAPQRVICVEMANGDGMVTPIDADWVLPSAGVGAASDADGIPIGLVALVIGIVVVAAVSVLAFRFGSR